MALKTCAVCGTVNSDDRVFCGTCAESLQNVRSQSIEEAKKISEKTQALLKAKTRHRTTISFSGIATLGIGLLLLLAGGYAFFFLGNAIGILLLIGAFLVLGSVTGFFQGAPSRGRGSWTLNRSRRSEDERKRRREIVDN